MKHKTLLSLCACIPLLMMGALHIQVLEQPGGGYLKPSASAAESQTPTPSKERKQSPSRAVTKDNFLYEGFETVDESTGLPEGWVTIATPDNPSDQWCAGRLNASAAGGYNCAYVLGGDFDVDHDTWLFSPEIHVTRPDLKAEFYVYLPTIGNTPVEQCLEVALFNSQNPDARVMEIYSVEATCEFWSHIEAEIGEIEPGDYCIGFHCASTAKANTMCIDEVQVSDGNYALFGVDRSVDFEVIDRHLAKSQTFILANSGPGNLSVSLKECSPELTCTGLPVEIGPYDAVEIPLTIKNIPEGEYEGFVTFESNDITHPEVTIPVYAVGKEYSVSDVIIEGFESGTQPVDWDQSRLTFVLKAYGAHDGSMAWYSCASYANPTPDLPGMGFITNYVRMGEDPEVSFWFKAFANGNSPADNSKVTACVKISNEVGEWDDVWAIGPDDAEPFEITGEFQQVVIPVPEKYRNKTCRVSVSFYSLVKGWSCYDYELLIDDVFVGTLPSNDAALQILQGPALLTVGQEGNYEVNVKNNSAADINGGHLALKDAFTGAIFSETECPTLPASSLTSVSFPWTPSAPGSYRLVAEYSHDEDSNAANNVSSAVNVSVVSSDNRAVLVEGGKEWTGGQILPVNFNSVENITQTIYHANELGINKGEINSLCYLAVLQEAYLSDNFKIWIAETDKDVFADRQFLPESDFVKVFDGNVYFPAGTSNMVIPFETPYEYKGGNLVVMATRDADNFMYGIYYKLWKTEDNDIRSMYCDGLADGSVFGNENASVYAVAAYPETLINMTYAPCGKIKGTISDANGQPVEGVKVTVKGSKLYALTDAEGKYELPKVAAGEVAVVLSASGYKTAETSAKTLSVDGTVSIDATIEGYPQVAVRGKVTNELNVGLPKAALTLDGYGNYTAVTDDNGNYVFDGVYAETGEDFNLTVWHPYFRTDRRTITVDGEKTLDLALAVNPGRPGVVVPAYEESSCTLSWSAPLVEYAHDSGVPSEFVGYSYGWEQVGMGARFLKKSEIKEVSFYVGSVQVGHNYFNVIIFGLDQAGNPNPNEILFKAENIDFVDDGWTTYKLPYPVQADGFVVFISCDGFIQMGVAEASMDYPFEPGQCYYAGYSYMFQLSDMETWKDAHFMIRAYGVDKGEWSGSEVQRGAVASDFAAKIKPSYDVYRFDADDVAGEWDKVASVAEESWTDPEYADLGAGKYRYAVKANYGDVVSIPSLSRVIDKQTTGIFSVGTDNLKVSLVGDDLIISDSDLVAGVKIYTLSGTEVVNISSPGNRISLSGIESGVLILDIATVEGNRHLSKIIR